MYTSIDERACDLAEYIIENQSTVRAAAKQFSISKSTVHKDLTERLPRLNPALYRQVRRLLENEKGAQFYCAPEKHYFPACFMDREMRCFFSSTSRTTTFTTSPTATASLG